MATLSTKARNSLPKSNFGLPGKKAYPMPDKSHAANAKARATQMVAKGKLSPSDKSTIDSKANKVLKSSGSAKTMGKRQIKATAARISQNITKKTKSKSQVGF